MTSIINRDREIEFLEKCYSLYSKYDYDIVLKCVTDYLTETRYPDLQFDSFDEMRVGMMIIEFKP